MPAEEQIEKYLEDVHSIECQALAQMRAAPDLVEDPEMTAAFAAHLQETERHERLVAERLEQLGESSSRLKDLAGTASGKGFVLFARAQPDTPGKLVAHAFSYEHMELAAYELLEHAAERAGDEATAALARRIGPEESAMPRASRRCSTWRSTRRSTAPGPQRSCPPTSPTRTRSRSRRSSCSNAPAR